jgi:PBP1b-binding outer membrane lipoprotein LpoB
MKKLLIIVLTILFITSCKSSKSNCDSYGQIQQVEQKKV